MRDVELFEAALGLALPWRVVQSFFDADRRRLELRIDFERGARFACPEFDRGGCEVHDAVEKRWRHLDYFFQHEAYLIARVPRVRCAEHGVRQVVVPWARAGSGFTLLFEALVMTLVAEMPVAAVGNLVSEHDTRIWRVHHHVDRALAGQDLSQVRRLAVDETSFRRGQDYVSVFADLDQARVVFATPTRSLTRCPRHLGGPATCPE